MKTMKHRSDPGKIKNKSARHCKQNARCGVRAVLVLLTAILLLPADSPAQTVRIRRNSSVRTEPDIKREPFRYAPELYADQQNLIVTLINLPGANSARSVWQVSYKVYFLSEAAHDRAVKNLVAGESNPRAADFPEKVLLAQGRFRKTSLNTLQKRTYTSAAIPLKSRVPDKERTKFSYIMTDYTVSITDAVLGQTLERSGILMNRPFDTEGGQAVPRRTMYVNFFVTPQGDFYFSQLPQSTAVALWQ